MASTALWREASPGARRAALIGAAVVAVALVGLAAAAGNPVASEPYVPPPYQGPPEPSDPAGVGGPPPASNTPEWLRWLLNGFVLLCGVALLVTIVVMTLRLLVGRDTGLLRRRVLEPDEIELLTTAPDDVDLLGRGRDLEAAVEQSMAALAAGGDVRAAVIAAWLRLEEAAAAAGTPHRDDDAPGDLVTRLLGSHDVRPRRLQTLAELYRRARFSPAPLRERDRDEAQLALADVRDDLAPGQASAGAAAGSVRSVDRWPTRWN